jgi:DNA-binding transcriptional LysR family regulator
MEMHQIRYFLAASKLSNFTRAAENCNVSQPALTTAIKRLEEELGAELFHREGKRLILSDFGRAMLPQFNQIAEQTMVVATMAQNFRLLNQTPIRLGVMSTIGPVRLSRLLAKFQNDHPGIDLTVQQGSLADLTGQLDEGEIDLAVLNPLDGLGEGYQKTGLYVENYVVIFAPEHRFENLSVVQLNDTSGEPYVDRLACEMREMVMKVYRDRDLELYARFRSQREDWVQAMVLAKLGFAFVPEYSITLPELKFRPLDDPAVSRTICLVSKPGRRHTPGVAAFMEAVRSFHWEATGV